MEQVLEKLDVVAIKSCEKEDLKEFFTKNGCHTLGQAVFENNISGETLLWLNEKDVADLVPSIGDRALLRKIITMLKEPHSTEVAKTKSLEQSTDENMTQESELLDEKICIEKLGGTASKVRRDWTNGFAFPKSFSPYTMSYLKGQNRQVLTNEMRKDIVNSLYFRMMDYVVLPTSGEYDFICEELIARWPKLKDESIGGSSDEAYGTWKNSLRWKFKNARRTKKATDMNGGKSKKRRVNEEELLSNELYEGYIEELKEKKKMKDHVRAREIMKLTFLNRREWIKDIQPEVEEVLQNFPMLKKPDYIEREFLAIIGNDVDLRSSKNWDEWRARILMYISHSQVSIKKLKTIEVDEEADTKRFVDEIDDVRNYYLLRKMEALLSPRAKTSLFMTTNDSTPLDEIIKNNKESAPIILRYINDDNGVTYYTLVEGQIIGHVLFAKDAAVQLVATYYIFNIKYPPLLSAVLQFLQHAIYKIKEKKLLDTVKKHMCDMLKLNIN